MVPSAVDCKFKMKETLKSPPHFKRFVTLPYEVLVLVVKNTWH